MIEDRKLTEHFRLHELLYSETAERIPYLKRLQFNPPLAVVEALEYLAVTVLEPVRVQLAVPLRVTSGYRSWGVNAAVGGSSSSQHLHGEAADLQVWGRIPEGAERFVYGEAARFGFQLSRKVNANFVLFALLALALEDFDIDQLIHEYGTLGRPAWVHVAASRGKDRRQILRIGNPATNGYGTKSAGLREALRWGE